MIPASEVRAWLRNPSVEVLGAINVHIMQNARRVEPPLSMEEICSTVQEYYRQCLVQDLQRQRLRSQQIDPRFGVGWFQTLWRDPAVPREYVTRLKTMLHDLFVEGNIPQDQMVGAVLEHLFETPQIAEFFADWESDPRLKDAFDQAMEWAKDHRRPNIPQA